MLTNASLLALADGSWVLLDLSCTWLTAPAVLTATQLMGSRLLALDLSGWDGLTAAVLRALAAHCPQLRVLRLGGGPAGSAALGRLERVMLQLLPALPSPVRGGADLLGDMRH